MKTSFFEVSNEQPVVNKAIEVIENFNGVSNQIMYKVFDNLYSMWCLAKMILDAHDGKIVPDEDPEDLRGMSSEEIASLIYGEVLEDFDTSFSETLAKDLLYSAYLKPNYSTEIFATAVYNLADIFNNLKSRLYMMTSYELDNDTKKEIQRHFYNLNYCLLVNFKLMSYKENKILNCIQYYTVSKQMSVAEIAEPMFNIFKENQPELPYLNNHPELFVKLEEVIPYSTLLDLIAYSDVVTSEEWNDMLPDADGNIKLVVDQLFFDELESRFAENVGNRFFETADGDN